VTDLARLGFGVSRPLASGGMLMLRFRPAASGIGPLEFHEAVQARGVFAPWLSDPDECASTDRRLRAYALDQAFAAYNRGDFKC
jgi:hypothetical protein